MSSQALYRKWRSQSFDDLIGQEHIVQALRNAISAGRIGHAYLFTGPRGVGKTSAARILSKAVNCEHIEPLQRPCAACAACVAIAEGRAVDVIEMDAASHTSVEDAREIIERVQFRPALFRKKVYVIDEVHMLSTAAFNALLKTLEEPPDHAMFILATTELHKVPATITSRCQRFVFNRHTVQNTAAHLEWVANQEHVTLDSGVAEAIARAATGSMRDAMSLLDQLIGYGQQRLTLDQVRSLLGSSAAEEVYHLVGALGRQAVGEALQAINAVTDQGADLRQFTRDIVGHLRSLMLIKAGGSVDLLDVSSDAQAILQEQATGLDLATLLHWLKVFSGLDHTLRTSPYGQLPLEMAVVESLAIPAAEVAPRRVPPPMERVEAPARTVEPRRSEPRPAPIHHEPSVVPIPSPQEQPRPVAMVEQPTPPTDGVEKNTAAGLTDAEITLGEVEAAWPTIIDEMKPFNPTLQALLRGCDPIGIENDTMLVLGASSPFHAGKIEEVNNRRLIEKVIQRVTNTALAVRCEPINQEDRLRINDDRRRREELMKDDYIRFARNIFNARIIGIEKDKE